MATLEAVKSIDQRTKNFINGYLRNIQGLFPIDNVYYTISMLVTHWILLYYYVREHFEFYAADNAVITDDGMTATNHSKYSQSASVYGHLVIPYCTKQIHEWKFKCIKYKSDSLWAIGIDEADSKSYCMQFYNDNQSYAFDAVDCIEACQERIRHAHTGWNLNDEITLIFNGSNKLLYIKINDDKESKSVKVKENLKGYRMVLYLGETGDCGKLLSYAERKSE